MSQYEEEKELIENCVKGDAAAQKKLFDLFSNRMFAVCLRYANDYEQAKDFLQEGFIKTFQKLEQFRSEGSFEGWLRRIFVTTALENHRRELKYKDTHGLEGYENLGQENLILDKLNMQDLLRLINSLPTGYRTVFNLFVIEGYTHAEIAKELEVSENTSKTQLHKARQFLMKKIKELQ